MDFGGLEAIVGFNGAVGDSFYQWSSQETQDFLIIRGELDPIFMDSKRNKTLWETVSNRMSEIGYQRSAQQCKSKWKNLITRYKGCETLETPEMRQNTFPFYNHMQIIFNTRLQRLAWQEQQEAAAVAAAAQHHQTLPADEAEPSSRKKKKKVDETSATIDKFTEIMEEYMRQQMKSETEWMTAFEKREERRRVREREWRERMEGLEKERMLMGRRWREREEQRKVRQEARAERRDALISALLDKIQN